MRFVGSLTAVVLALGCVVAAPARAREVEDTWTVAPGGAVSGTAAAEIRNVTRGWTVRCTNSRLGGTAPSGSGLPRYGVLSFDQASFGSCTGPNGVAFTVTTGNLPWDVYADTYDAAQRKTAGTLQGVELTLDAAGGCRLDVSGTDGNFGTADATHTNDDHVLATSGTTMGVTFTNFACSPSFVTSGDTIELAARFPLTPGQTISSP